MSRISVVQLNMRKAFVASMELGRRVTKLDSEVICLITEPFRYRNRLCSLPRGFKSLAVPLQARAAIFWRGNFDILKIESLCNKDCAVGIVKLGKSNVLLVSGYLDINLKAVPDWLSNVIKYSSKKKYPVLLGLDTNAHSTLYGPISNPRGEEIEDFITVNGLRVENVGEIPTFETVRGGRAIATFIDLTLTYNFNNIADWHVDQSYNGSDHNTIYFIINKLSLIHI